MSGVYFHHTDAYNWNCTVFRRGFPIHFLCPCDDSNNINSIIINLRTGRGQLNRGSKEIKLSMGYEVEGWSVTYEKNGKKNFIVVIIKSSPNSIIGQYFTTIFVNSRLHLSVRFLLFFNPWCKNDPVYLEDEEKRQEYVMNTHTLIYQGTYHQISCKGWYLAQFQPYSVETVLMLLDKLSISDRNSPIKVSRHLSALVNANDDNGIVQGNWTGSYRGGTNPLAWNGSNYILSKYARYKRSVKYGQCWVFCGVLCTVLRTCGIPARCVTTYNAFHDHDGTLSWEIYFNRNMRQVRFRRQETMWNFHCWNEAWMDRSDLSLGFSGWQIVDSTPQERSMGFYRCGPASQLAVKEGNVDLAYDTGFVFAEVNADKIYYFQKPNGRFTIGRIDTHTIGQNISAKAVGVNRREDITQNYKHPDGSQAERIVQNKVQNKRKRYRDLSACPVQIRIFYPPNTNYKTDCPIQFKFTNNSRLRVKVRFRVQISSISYRGRLNFILRDQIYETIIDGLSDKSFQEIIQAYQLKKTLVKDISLIKVEVNGIVNGDSFLHSELMFEVDSPRISILGIPENMLSRMKYQLRISVTNPMDTPLTNVKIYLSGDVLVHGREKIVVGTIETEETHECYFDVFSRAKGEKYVYASLNSNEISGFDRYVSIKFN